MLFRSGALRDIDHDAGIEPCGEDAHHIDAAHPHQCTGQRRKAGILLLGHGDDIVVDEGLEEQAGLHVGQFAWAVIKSELLYPKRLVFKSENLYFSCMEESLRLGEKMMGNGAELLEKKRTKQKKPKKRRGRGDAFD